jgi:F-type H+-transporting ATPase subunit delta
MTDTMEERVRGYANAMFEVARVEGALDQVAEELFQFSQTLQTSDELRTHLTDQAIPVERRAGVVEDLLGPRAHPVTTNLVSFVVGAGRAGDLPEIVETLVQHAAEAKDKVVAEVRVVQPLTDDQRQRLSEALSRSTRHNVDLRVIIDPTVLGGVLTQIGDTVIDGSVRTRLARMRERR